MHTFCVKGKLLLLQETLFGVLNPILPAQHKAQVNQRLVLHHAVVMLLGIVGIAAEQLPVHGQQPVQMTVKLIRPDAHLGTDLAEIHQIFRPQRHGMVTKGILIRAS